MTFTIGDKVRIVQDFSPGGELPGEKDRTGEIGVLIGLTSDEAYPFVLRLPSYDGRYLAHKIELVEEEEETVTAANPELAAAKLENVDLRTEIEGLRKALNRALSREEAHQLEIDRLRDDLNRALTREGNANQRLEDYRKDIAAVLNEFEDNRGFSKGDFDWLFDALALSEFRCKPFSLTVTIELPSDVVAQFFETKDDVNDSGIRDALQEMDSSELYGAISGWDAEED